jgi:hypothetical protein
MSGGTPDMKQVFRRVDAEVLFLVIVVVMNVSKFPQADGEVIGHGLVVEEILFDHASAIAQAEHEVLETMMRIELHDVLEDRASADVHQGFGAEFRLFAQTGTLPTA